MSRSEIVLLRDPSESPLILEDARSILSQMGIVYREEVLPGLPSLSGLRSLMESIGQSVCVLALGRGAYILPIVAASLVPQQPLIVMPCPSEQASMSYLDTIFETVRGYPVAFTRPHDAQTAVLLGVHFLVSRHPSYADILNAFIQKRHLQPS
ncbi:MAG: AIR carboxylase family protein [Bacteroidia bacterium]|nr:AIR carboxylase family protein [Bacteroidia bacterium]